MYKLMILALMLFTITCSVIGISSKIADQQLLSQKATIAAQFDSLKTQTQALSDKYGLEQYQVTNQQFQDAIKAQNLPSGLSSVLINAYANYKQGKTQISTSSTLQALRNADLLKQWSTNKLNEAKPLIQKQLKPVSSFQAQVSYAKVDNTLAQSSSVGGRLLKASSSISTLSPVERPAPFIIIIIIIIIIILLLSSTPAY